MDGSVDHAVSGPVAASLGMWSARFGIFSPTMPCANVQMTNVFSPETDMTLSQLSDSSCSVSNSSFSLSSMSPSSSPVSCSSCQSAKAIPPGKRKVRSRKKAGYKHVPHCLKPPHLVAKRNARERKRVQAVNSAFSKLRKHVPCEPRHKRLSKVKTLRFAIDYIRRLQELIYIHDTRLQRGENVTEESCCVSGIGSNPREHQGTGTRARHQCHENGSQKGSPPVVSNARRRAKLSDAPVRPVQDHANEIYINSSGPTSVAQHNNALVLDLKRQDIHGTFVLPSASQPCNQQAYSPILIPTDVGQTDHFNGSNDAPYNVRYPQNNPPFVTSAFQTETGSMTDSYSRCTEARHYSVVNDCLYDSYRLGNVFTCRAEPFQETRVSPHNGVYTKRFPLTSREANQGCSEATRQLRDLGFSSSVLESGLVLGENCGLT